MRLVSSTGRSGLGTRSTACGHSVGKRQRPEKFRAQIDDTSGDTGLRKIAIPQTVVKDLYSVVTVLDSPVGVVADHGIARRALVYGVARATHGFRSYVCQIPSAVTLFAGSNSGSCSGALLSRTAIAFAYRPIAGSAVSP